MSVVDDVRKVAQDFLAPELRGITERLDALEKNLGIFRSDVTGRFADVKADIGDLRSEMTGGFGEMRLEMNGRFADLKSEMNGKFVDLKSEIAELKSEMADLKSEMNGKLADIKADSRVQADNLRADFRAGVNQIVTAFQIEQRLEWLESQARKQLPPKEQ